MGRRKKVVEEAPPIIELEDTPHHSFCVACKNSDMRIIKDNLNMAVITINRMCTELEIDKDKFQLKCKELNAWVDDQKKLRVLNQIKLDKHKKKLKKQKGNNNDEVGE